MVKLVKSFVSTVGILLKKMRFLLYLTVVQLYAMKQSKKLLISCAQYFMLMNFVEVFQFFDKR